MSRHDDQVSMRQMLDHAREAVDITKSKAREDLDRDRMLNLALTRLIEIIGEAANRIDNDTQLKHPEIPWAEIIAMRNRVIHAYDEVDLNVLWDVIDLDLPPLIEQLWSIVEQ
jgi:uncharacterized protein with HEPN domain